MNRCLSAAKLILTLKCEQSTHLVSDSLDRELTLTERWAVRLHYIGCWSCRRFGRQIRMLRKTLQKSVEAADEDAPRLSAEAMDRIRAAIDSEN